MNRNILRVLAISCYLLCIVGANWALNRWGFISVGFGLMAPAGVYFAGFALSARDFVQEEFGQFSVIPLILIGAAISWWIEPSFAIASGVAFLLSELADWSIYTPLRERHRYWALSLSNTVGAVVDSWIFLWIAFGSIAHWQGLVLGKLWTVAPALLLMFLWRNRDDLSLGMRSRQST